MHFGGRGEQAIDKRQGVGRAQQRPSLGNRLIDGRQHAVVSMKQYLGGVGDIEPHG
jgi:hypothetical protein